MVPNAATPITSTTTPQRSRRLTLLSATEVVRRLGFIPAPVLSRPALLPLAMPVTFHRTSARTTLRRWPHRPSCLPPGGGSHPSHGRSPVQTGHQLKDG